MVIFPLAPDQTIAQMWSIGARGGVVRAANTNDRHKVTEEWKRKIDCTKAMTMTLPLCSLSCVFILQLLSVCALC